MISSFFSKTQPIHYIILLGTLFIFFWLAESFFANPILSITYLMPKILYISVLVVSVYLADIMAKKGKMTDQSSHLLLFFVLQTLLFPEALLNIKGIFAQFFLLLAASRLLDAKNLKNIKHKVFDGSILISIASLFCPWALLFFLLVLYTVNTYAAKSLKTWLSAVLGILVFALLTYTVLLVINDGGYVKAHYSFNFDFQRLQSRVMDGVNLKMLGYALLILVFGIIDFVKFRKKGGGKIILFQFMLLFFVLALLVDFLDLSNESYVILAFFPAAIFLSNYVQTIKKARLKEIILTLFLVVPLLLSLFKFLVS